VTTIRKQQSYTMTLTRNCGKVARYDAELPDGTKVNFYAPHGEVVNSGAPPQKIKLTVMTAS
jgi:hypothetical protein